MAHEQPRLITLAEAARLTGHPEESLRHWCATGRLRGERIGTAWYLLESDLHDASRMSEHAGRRQGSGRSVLAIAFSDPSAGQRAFDELRARFGAAASELEMGPLALDGNELMLIAGAFPDEAYESIASLARRHGGLVVEDVDEAWTGRRSVVSRRPRDEGQASYG